MDAVTPDSAETHALLCRAGAGDRAAFEQLFARYRVELRRFVELRLDSRLRARVDASDVVQDAQLDAYRRLADYLARRPMPFRLWLRRTAYERLLKLRRGHLEAARRAAGREAPLPDGSSLLLVRQLLAPGSTPSQQLDRREADREVLLLRSFEGLSNRETAQVLGLTPATASQRFGRSLLRLRGLLLDGGLAEFGNE